MGDERGDQVAEEGLPVRGGAGEGPVFHVAAGHGGGSWGKWVDVRRLLLFVGVGDGMDSAEDVLHKDPDLEGEVCPNVITTVYCPGTGLGY